MSLEDLIKPFPWSEYSKRVADKVKKPFSCGRFLEEEIANKGMFLATGSDGLLADGNAITIYLLVDETDGMVVDAKFQAFGHTALLAAAESFCSLVSGMHILQSKRISADLIEKKLRDNSEISALPFEAYNHINLVLGALDNAIEACKDIVFQTTYETPILAERDSAQEVANWAELSAEQQKEILEKVIAQEIRPYVELDAGGVEVLEIVGGKEVIIAYQGSCTSCVSAVGTTLTAIEQILQNKVHPAITVVPHMDSLKIFTTKENTEKSASRA